LWKGETLAKIVISFNLFSISLSDSLSNSSPEITPLLFSPISLEIASAVSGLSPVIIMTFMPAV